jgi:hypothetical protein
MVPNEPNSDEPTLLEELQAGLGEEQQLLEELAGTLEVLRAAARSVPGELDREGMWREVNRRLEAMVGGEAPPSEPVDGSEPG